ncbi:MAG: hypothetical protein HY591_01510 [Candidatus Omnitrophica bacterium]|nr:hypothetical protein [Candidatus Omnitrophota bacterium]
MGRRKITPPRGSSGQAATELAVFGAVLIFLIGGIVRSSVSTSYQQNQQLKAMRLALLKSYQGTARDSKYAGRNSVSVLYIEDRLSPDLGKYGSMERVPFMAQGSGTMSNMLNYPLDAADYQKPQNIPVMDVYINGKYFKFTTARLMTKKTSDRVPGVLNPPAGYSTSYPAASTPSKNGLSRFGGWDFRCQCDAATCYGCPVFYSARANPDKCKVDTDPMCKAPESLSESEQFDLNRNDDFSDDPPASAVSGRAGRADMIWKWKGVRAVKDNIEINRKDGVYPMYDVDNDGQEEKIYDDALYDSPPLAKGIIKSVTVLDFQDGDLNMFTDNFSPGLQPGLQKTTAVYTRTKEGTYLQIKEGKLYNPESGVFVRSAGSKDQAEIIQRMFQLSMDTGRFCDGAGSPRDCPDGRGPDGKCVEGYANPVEACVIDPSPAQSCFTPDKVKLTCFDQRTKMLYVRSRILDKSGSFWKTDVEGGLP